MVHFLCGVDLIVQPDESQYHFLRLFRGLDGIQQDVLVVAVGFAHLSLHLIALDGMFETLLGHTDEDGSIGCRFFGFKSHVDDTEREGRKGFVSSGKQTFDELLAA